MASHVQCSWINFGTNSMCIMPCSVNNILEATIKINSIIKFTAGNYLYINELGFTFGTDATRQKLHELNVVESRYIIILLSCVCVYCACC